MAWADEVEKRKLAGREEPFAFVEAERNCLRVRSGSGNTWLVAPDLTGLPASCDCPDFRTARLGTCKHVEAARLFRAGEKPSVEPPPRAPKQGKGLEYSPRGGEVLVLDLETQRAFDEVPDRRADRLGLSVCVLWSYEQRRFSTYWEEDAAALIERLEAADLVIGFNHRRFDFEVLRPYAQEGILERVPTFDLLTDLHQRLGHRISLDACVRPTLGAGKSGHGLQAITWWREGRRDLLEEYCREDVRLTRDLFDRGRMAGGIEIERRGRNGMPRVERLAVQWDAPGLPPPVARDNRVA